ncbi:hypothetical protein [Granulicella arctica]|uniref:hypothetical protein n=1 Tax=Granulicella arctica TaxID=940613 RepID=UPI0021DFB110|nr:hypothetical protein [Granulicella arctica]
MVLDIAKPVALLLSILSLFSVFHAAFLVTATTVNDRIDDSLFRLAFAAGIAIISGLLFREAERDYEARFDAEFNAFFGTTTAPAPAPSLAKTLPVRVFCWATAAMIILFAVSWYIETYVVLYNDIQRY